MVQSAITIKYQNVPCVEASFSRTSGLNSDSGYVNILTRPGQSVKLKDEEIAPDIGMRVGKPITTFVPGLPSPIEADFVFDKFGDLEINDGVNEVKITNVFIDKNGIKEIMRGENGASLWQITLADIRHLWDERGVVAGNYNITAPDNYGKRNLAELLQDCADGLGVNIYKLKTQSIYPESIYPPVKWAGGKYAKEALSELIEQYALVPVINSKNELGFYDYYEISEQNVSAPPFNLAPINHEGITKGWHYQYDSVMVAASGHSQQEITVHTFEPVATLDRDYMIVGSKGSPIALDTLLDLWGYKKEDFMRAILTTEKAQERAFDDVPGKDKEEKENRKRILQQQGMRWFRMKKAPLPMLPMKKIKKDWTLEDVGYSVGGSYFIPTSEKSPNKGFWENRFEEFVGDLAPAYDKELGIIKFKRPMGIIVPRLDLIYSRAEREYMQPYIEEHRRRYEKALEEIDKLGSAFMTLEEKSRLVGKTKKFYDELAEKWDKEIKDIVKSMSDKFTIKNIEECELLPPVIQCSYAYELKEYWQYIIGNIEDAFLAEINGFAYYSSHYAPPSNVPQLFNQARQIVNRVVSIPPTKPKYDFVLNGAVNFDIDGSYSTIAWDAKGDFVQTTIYKDNLEQHAHLLKRGDRI